MSSPSILWMWGSSPSSGGVGASPSPARRRSSCARQPRLEPRPIRQWSIATVPIATAGPGTVVWFIGAAPDGLAGEIEATGATVMHSTLDPLAELVRVQRVALALAALRGLDPDRPPNLSRAVVLGTSDREEVPR